ncbi:hypothetical protein [Streptomyces sp. NPDC020298]|uniref:hypothetical protein n=1 Tax=unclassified Streptomyces TaxID=2593676 RepID=UPI0033FD043B
MAVSSAERIRARVRLFRSRVESAVTRCVLLGVVALGILAQFVKPVGDFLEGKMFLGGALLSAVAYILYDALKDLADTPPNGRNTPPVTNPHSLGPYIDEAFTARTVNIRFIGYTGETLFLHLQRLLLDVLTTPGRTRSVTIRILVPDLAGPVGLPCTLHQDGSTSDDPEFREYQTRRTRDYSHHLSGLALRLRESGVDVTVEFRTYPGIPVFKLYIFNEDMAFTGFYDVAWTSGFPIQDPTRTLLNPKGPLTSIHGWNSRHGNDESKRFVRDSTEFFEGLWKISAELV